MTWQKGQSGNPSGRPKGARNLLSESVLKELISHWEENGLDAIDRTCKEQPAAYSEGCSIASSEGLRHDSGEG